MKIALLGLALISAVLVGARLSAPQTPKVTALVGADWINGEALPFKGRVTVLHFWTFACINCKHNIPYYNRWQAKYEPAEVQVVGIHTPELEIEKNPANVREAVKQLGIGYPVLLDGKFENWDLYKVEVWPTVFLIDKKGQIRKTWKGELQWNGSDGFAELTKEIEQLRKEKE